MDQSKFADVEEKIICPYDPIHHISRLRMANHLQRCRLNWLELSQRLVTCSFNYTHKIPKPEIEFHETVCPDRDAFYAFEYSVGTKENSAVQELLKNTEKKVEVPQEESWDSEVDQPNANVLNVIERHADDRGVLKLHQNIPPSERKMKREEDAQKMKARLNAEEEAKINRNNMVSSVVSTPSAWPALNEGASSSRAVPSSARSVMSDSSFNTALNDASVRLNAFQLVERKGRGRSAKAKNTGSTSLAGVGRGRARSQKDSN